MQYIISIEFTKGIKLEAYLDNGVVYGIVTRDGYRLSDGWYNGLNINQVIRHVATAHKVAMLTN